MKILTVNCGSSTLKFKLFDTELEDPLAGGIVDRIGGDATLDFAAKNGQSLREASSMADHGEATQRLLEWLGDVGLGEWEIDAVGHRVVHGGARFVEPTLIDDRVVEAIEALGELAPLHNGPALSAIRAARGALGPGVPIVATFDTAFHRTMPQRASHYAISPDLAADARASGCQGFSSRG